jgi:uncharacterized protein
VTDPNHVVDGRCAIGVMAKAPRAGHAKTRLCPALSPSQAAALSAAFLRDVTGRMTDATRTAPIAGYAAYAPAGSEALLTPHLAPGTDLLLADGSAPMPPGVEGFGRCLLHAMQGLFARGHAAACVLSSDVPTLPARLLVEAARHLLAPGPRAVLGACADGGYYLLGLKVPEAQFFTDIAWSTDTVAAATRQRAREVGLDLVELEPWDDVDDAAALLAVVAEADLRECPATHEALERLGIRQALADAARRAA